MLTFDQLAGLIQSSDFAGQITGAVTTVALEIQSEDAETPNHANRMAWAKSALADPSGSASQMRAAVLGTYADVLPPSAGVLTDAQIRAAVEDTVDTFANGV